MKRILLSTAAVALLLTTACTTTTTEDTNVNATDTVNMLPPADNTGPGIEGANPEMRDPNAAGDMSGNPNGSTSGSTPNSGSGSTSGSSGSGSNSANTNAANDNRGSGNSGATDVVVPGASPQDRNGSTYKRAAPGDSVDSRTNMGSSR